jgi:hypothetical protein
MQAVAHLVPFSAKANVAQRFSPPITVYPKRQNTLLSLPELTRTGHNPTSIDVDGKLKRIAILESELFRGAFGCAIK